MLVQRILEWLQNTPASHAIAQSPMLFPVIESVHVLVVAFMVGSIAVVDLRLVGLIGRDQRPSRLADGILPWTWVTFAATLVTGGLLFTSQPLRYASSAALHAKLAMIALAGLNMLLFHFVTGRDCAAWPERAPTPLRAKIAGALSLILWSGVIVSSRWIYETIAFSY